MLMAGKCVKVTQLPDSDHADKIFLMPRQNNLIGVLPQAQKICEEPQWQRPGSGGIRAG
jgi:hypothetical protein